MITTQTKAQGTVNTVDKEIWLGHLRDWEKQGKTASQYCREHGLSIHQFKYWQYRYASHTKRVSKRKTSAFSGVSFIPIEVVNPALSSPPKAVLYIGTKGRIEFESLDDERLWKPLLNYLVGV